MIALVTEKILFWVAVAAVFEIVGFAFAKGFARPRLHLVGLSACACSLALGAILVFVVDTDAKKIRRTTNELAEAFERNDVGAILERVDPSAEKSRKLVELCFRCASFEVVNVSEYELLGVDKSKEPRRAAICARAVARGAWKDIENYPFTLFVDFKSVEWIKGPDGKWRVGDDCVFDEPQMALGEQEVK